MDDQAITQPVYVTRWALTTGIMKFETGRLCPSDSNPETYFSAKWYKGGSCSIFVGKKDWTYSLDEARERVKVLVQRKLKALDRQRKKLETFEPKLVEPGKTP